jgi:dUTP pyrophosphatase
MNDTAGSHGLPIRVVATAAKWLPSYQSQGASGADLLAAIDQAIHIPAGGTSLIPTGLFLEIPEGFEVQVRSRSGLAYKSQISVLNSPGTIDSDYRGEVKVILQNHGTAPFVVEPGMRIAQMVVCPIVRAEFVPVASLTPTDRGHGGFGHTGVHTPSTMLK